METGVRFPLGLPTYTFAKLYGITTSAMVRIVLTKTFTAEGNVFNADKDNNGKGMPIDDLIQRL